MSQLITVTDLSDPRDHIITVARVQDPVRPQRPGYYAVFHPDQHRTVFLPREGTPVRQVPADSPELW